VLVGGNKNKPHTQLTIGNFWLIQQFMAAKGAEVRPCRRHDQKTHIKIRDFKSWTCEKGTLFSKMLVLGFWKPTKVEKPLTKQG